MNIYYRFIRNNQDYKNTLSIFYERGYHWSSLIPNIDDVKDYKNTLSISYERGHHWSSLIPNIDDVKNNYIFGVDSYLRYGCHGCKLNDFKKTILLYFDTDSANFINLKINSVLELG